MGLDSFWGRPTKGELFEPANDVKLPRRLRLCGGMFSGSGDGSFRGKVYAELIEAATGVSLYQEEIPSAVVKQMATALEAFEVDPRTFDVKQAELDDLKLMFRTYADADCSLYGWW